MAPPLLLFFFTAPATTEIYTLSLHDALPISISRRSRSDATRTCSPPASTSTACTTGTASRSEEHTSELQSLRHLVCRLLLEKKKTSRQAERRGHETARNRADGTPTHMSRSLG